MPAFRFFRKLTKRFFILTNTIVALLFILSCYGYLLDPLNFWFTGFITIGSIFLLLIVLLFIFFWLVAKPFYMIIGIAAIAICWNPLKHLVQLQMSPTFSIKKHPSHLRVMDWNVESFNLIKHKTDPGGRAEMYRIIKLYNPDVAVFQEAAIGDSSDRAINYLPEMMRELKMKDYHYSYGQSFDKDHHFGKIIFSKVPLISKHTIIYDKKDYNSMYQYADLVFNKDTFRIFNIHLESLRFNADDRKLIGEPDREIKMKTTRNIIYKLKKGFINRKFQSDRVRRTMDNSPYPNIVCGDFNDVPNSYAYYKIGDGLKNAFVEKGTGIGRTYNMLAPTLRIDNIFLDNRISVEQFIRVKQKTSEHNPLVTDIFYEKIN